MSVDKLVWAHIHNSEISFLCFDSYLKLNHTSRLYLSYILQLTCTVSSVSVTLKVSLGNLLLFSTKFIQWGLVQIKKLHMLSIYNIAVIFILPGKKYNILSSITLDSRAYTEKGLTIQLPTVISVVQSKLKLIEIWCFA